MRENVVPAPGGAAGALLWRRLGIAVAVLLVVVLGIQTWRQGMRPQGFDLGAYLAAGRAVLAGVSPYDQGAYFEYVYPPAFAVLMAPLALLPYPVVLVLWYLLGIGGLTYALVRVRAWVLGTHARRFERADFFVGLLAAVILWRTVHANATNGQANLLVLALCTGFFAAWQRGRPMLAGLLLALAVHVKVVPILLVLLLIVRDQRRTLVWTAVFGVVLAALPGLVHGDEILAVYRDFAAMIEHKLARYTVHHGAATIGARGDLEFMSLRGFVCWLWPELAPSRMVGHFAVLCVVLGTALYAWTRRERGGLLPFAVLLAAGLLIAPMNEKHHLALAIPVVWIGLLALRRPGRCDLLQFVLLGALLACAYLSKALPEGPFYFGLVVVGLAAATRVEERVAPEAVLDPDAG